tara:strand:+ start:8384 stop:8611 length:228 start_codon:yes stop_codon:yes gene_type:complete
MTEKTKNHHYVETGKIVTVGRFIKRKVPEIECVCGDKDAFHNNPRFKKDTKIKLFINKLRRVWLIASIEFSQKNS